MLSLADIKVFPCEVTFKSVVRDSQRTCNLEFAILLQGAGREGLWVQTEFLAVIAALLIWWCANNMKSKLQE